MTTAGSQSATQIQTTSGQAQTRIQHGFTFLPEPAIAGRKEMQEVDDGRRTTGGTRKCSAVQCSATVGVHTYCTDTIIQ
jgi:hypothetical protein